jgi:hypothetical protein
VGVAMTTTILGQPLVGSPAARLFAELDRRGTVLYLHPAGNAACSPLIGEHYGTWSVGAPIEDTISALHLITHGIPSHYPQMKIVNSHLGGALPMLIQRLDNQLPWEAPETPEQPSVAARRMWYDTVGHGHPPALRCAADSFGVGRLALGTDFPYENGAVFERAVSYITSSGLTPGDADRVRRGALRPTGSVTSCLSGPQVSRHVSGKLFRDRCGDLTGDRVGRQRLRPVDVVGLPGEGGHDRPGARRTGPASAAAGIRSRRRRTGRNAPAASPPRALPLLDDLVESRAATLGLSPR